MSIRLVSILLVVSGATFVALVTGATYLEASLPGGLPVGNALAALCFVSAAGAGFGLSRAGSAHRYLSSAALLGAMLWLPASIALAGNLTLNFAGARGQLWINLSVTLLVAIVFSLAWALVRALWRRRAVR